MNLQGILRGVAASLLVGLLPGCGLLPPSEQSEFSVGSSPPPVPPVPFHNTDPGANAILARGYCADGYELLSGSDKAEIWPIRCKPYAVSFKPAF